MALKGSLGDLMLPDLIRLVSLSGKSGIVRLSSEGRTGSVYFRGGEVFFARSDSQREPLGKRLVEAGRIGADELGRALHLLLNVAGETRRLGEILVDEGAITRETLEWFVQEQIQDTVFDMFDWESGSFEFEAFGAPPVLEDIGLSVSVENIVMAASRKLASGGRASASAAGAHVAYRLAIFPGPGSVDISLTPEEWRMLLLCDGSRSVADIARVTGLERANVGRALRGLLDAGVLELAGASPFADRAPSLADDELTPAVSEADGVSVESTEESGSEGTVATEAAMPEEERTPIVLEPEDAPPETLVTEVREVSADSAPEAPVAPVRNLSERIETGELAPTSSMWAGLGDEVTALTGAIVAPRRSARPPRVVPDAIRGDEAAGVFIRRDAGVSKRTIQAIRDGLARL